MFEYLKQQLSILRLGNWEIFGFFKKKKLIIIEWPKPMMYCSLHGSWASSNFLGIVVGGMQACYKNYHLFIV